MIAPSSKDIQWAARVAVAWLLKARQPFAFNYNLVTKVLGGGANQSLLNDCLKYQEISQAIDILKRIGLVLIALGFLTGCALNLTGPQLVPTVTALPDVADPAPLYAAVGAGDFAPVVGSAWDGVVCADGLNVRAGPGVEYPVQRQLERGASVTVWELSGWWGWLGNGWVNVAYVGKGGACTSE